MGKKLTVKEPKKKHLKLRGDQQSLLAANPQGLNKNYQIGQHRFRDQETERKLLDAANVPVPKLDVMWQVKDLLKDKSRKKKGLIGRSELTEKKLVQLKEQAEKTPGSTRMEVQNLIKSFPKKRDLYMLSALCTHRMLRHTKGELSNIVSGLRMAVLDASTALLSDGLTLNNLRHFFEIYFAYLEKLQRLQQRAYDLVRNDQAYGALRLNLIYAMQITDLLKEKQKGCNAMLGYLTEKFNKSSMANTHFDFLTIKKAVDYINGGMPMKKLAQGQADKIVEYVAGITNTLAKIPVLDPLVNELMKALASTKINMRMQQVAIFSSRLFFEFKIAVTMHDIDTMKKLAKRIYSVNLKMLKTVRNRSIRHASEFDPYLNLALITEFSLNLYKPTERNKMVSAAMKVLERVALLDGSDDRRFMQMSDELMSRLDGLLDADPNLKLDMESDPLADEDLDTEGRLENSESQEAV